MDNNRFGPPPDSVGAKPSFNEKQVRDLKMNDCFRMNWGQGDEREVFLVTNISGHGDERTIHCTGRSKHMVLWPHTYDYPVSVI